MKRVGNAFKGVIGGLIFIVVGVILLWWNEDNNVKNIKTTEEMKASYIDVTSEIIDSSNEGKLIATNGPIIYNGEVIDTIFNVRVDSPLLKRVVEAYQWEEESSTDEDGYTTYTYNKVWKDYIIDSSEFHEGGHDNAFSLPYNNETYVADEVYVGAFKLTKEQASDLSTKGVVKEFDSEKVLEKDYTIHEQYLTTSIDLANPKIGDIRISFEYHDAKELSVLAVQRGDGFEDYESSVEKTVSKMVDGKYNGEQLVTIIEKENKILKWVLRIAGIIASVIGVATILKPISAASSYIPVLGNVVGAAVGLVSLIIGLAISFVVIAIAWIRYRPMIGLILFAAVAVLIVLLIIRSKGKKEEPVVQTQPVVQAEQNSRVEPVQEVQMPQPTPMAPVEETSVQPIVNAPVTPPTLDGLDAQVPEQVVAPVVPEPVVPTPVQGVGTAQPVVQPVPVEQTPVQPVQNDTNNQM